MIKNIDNLEYESHLWQKGISFIAGVDEVGRGCLAGDVVTCSVILDNNPQKIKNLLGVTDSKKLNEKKREYFFEIIKENVLDYQLGIISEKIIDEINILQATFLAMRESINKLKVLPEHILVDGNKKIPKIEIEQTTIIKGDFHSLSISCASILAKVTRDRIISEKIKEYPQYGFEKHKGYATKEHIDAIKKYGLSDIHRKTFCKNFFVEQMSLF
ncbi:MAG: ribonuclease HII [Candidatus Sericytochromatia bacterium]